MIFLSCGIGAPLGLSPTANITVEQQLATVLMDRRVELRPLLSHRHLHRDSFPCENIEMDRHVRIGEIGKWHDQRGAAVKMTAAVSPTVRPTLRMRPVKMPDRALVRRPG